jgi:hypothetical protein
MSGNGETVAPKSKKIGRQYNTGMAVRDAIRQDAQAEERNESWKKSRKESNNKKARNRGRAADKKPETALYSRKGKTFYDRPKWTPPLSPGEPIPKLVCAICEKPITDVASAMCDRQSEAVFHFDCITVKLKQRESLAEGEALSYIGGGRFGIVRRDSQKKFTIEKIIEWDKREDRVPWRKIIADHYSST